MTPGRSPYDRQSPNTRPGQAKRSGNGRDGPRRGVPGEACPTRTFDAIDQR
jgi:hypothetical protein